jgi:hypothetical protein
VVILEQDKRPDEDKTDDQNKTMEEMVTEVEKGSKKMREISLLYMAYTKEWCGFKSE